LGLTSCGLENPSTLSSNTPRCVFLYPLILYPKAIAYSGYPAQVLNCNLKASSSLERNKERKKERKRKEKERKKGRKERERKKEKKKKERERKERKEERKEGKKKKEKEIHLGVPAVPRSQLSLKFDPWHRKGSAAGKKKKRTTPSCWLGRGDAIAG